MNNRNIDILVNEREQSIPAASTVGYVRDLIKPDADVLIVNGFPAEEDDVLKGGGPAGSFQTWRNSSGW